MLTGLEYTGAIGIVFEGVLQLGQVEGWGGGAAAIVICMIGAGIGSIAGQDGRGANRAQVRGAGVVVIGATRAGKAAGASL